MSEEEIIEIINNYIKALKKPNPFLYTNEQKAKAIQGLLDLYNQEKEKNKLLKTYKGNLPKNVELICLCKDDFERNISTDYISKDKIKYYYKKICASVNHFQSKNDNNIVLRIKKYLEELLEE